MCPSGAAATVGLGGIACFGGLIGTQLVLTPFLQFGRHFTAGDAGLGNLPLAVGTASGGGVSGAFLADRIGRKDLQLGPLVQLAGAAVLWFEFGGAAPHPMRDGTASVDETGAWPEIGGTQPPCGGFSLSVPRPGAVRKLGSVPLRASYEQCVTVPGGRSS